MRQLSKHEKGTILITGGAGFIGSHLCEALLKKGLGVVVCDDLSTGSLKNIAHLRKNKNFILVKGSVTDKKLMERLIRRADEIYHLAASVGVTEVISRPLRMFETNIIGSHTILTLAAKYRKKILMASTSEVYGKLTKIPFKETDDSVLGSTSKIRWAYACSKMADEFLALTYFREKQLPVVTVRLFNTVGPRQTGQYGMVVPRFVKQALSREPITVYGSGKQSRCFVHVSEVVEAMVKLMANKKAFGQVINIGSQNEISIGDLAKKVKKLTSSKSRIINVPYYEAYSNGFEDMERRVPDISLAKKLIGFRPKYSIEEIIRSVKESIEQTK